MKSKALYLQFFSLSSWFCFFVYIFRVTHKRTERRRGRGWNKFTMYWNEHFAFIAGIHCICCHRRRRCSSSSPSLLITHNRTHSVRGGCACVNECISWNFQFEWIFTIVLQYRVRVYRILPNTRTSQIHTDEYDCLSVFQISVSSAKLVRHSRREDQSVRVVRPNWSYRSVAAQWKFSTLTNRRLDRILLSFPIPTNWKR